MIKGNAGQTSNVHVPELDHVLLALPPNRW